MSLMSSNDFIKKVMEELSIDYTGIYSCPCMNEKNSIEELKEIFENYQKKKEKLWNLRMVNFEIEGKIAGLKFEIFQILKENQVLAFNLSGTMSQYLNLNKIKNSKEVRKDPEIIELIEKYTVLSEFNYD
ncbi:MAG: hypothetical protein ACP5SF_05810 [Thermoplasmata archaeon]